MKSWRVHYLFHKARSAPVSAMDVGAAETTFLHHHRGCTVERVEPLDQSAPTPPAPSRPARPRVRACLLPPEEQERLLGDARRLTAELRAQLFPTAEQQLECCGAISCALSGHLLWNMLALTLGSGHFQRHGNVAETLYLLPLSAQESRHALPLTAPPASSRIKPAITWPGGKSRLRFFHRNKTCFDGSRLDTFAVTATQGAFLACRAHGSHPHPQRALGSHHD